MVESIIDSLKEYKGLCEFNATNFNADKVKLYEKVRQMMAGKYAREKYFGPVEKTVAEKPVKEMSKEEYKAYKVVHDKEAEMIKKGCNRIKEKVKNIRQDYSKAVVSGTRSGSGKIHYRKQLLSSSSFSSKVTLDLRIRFLLQNINSYIKT